MDSGLRRNDDTVFFQRSDSMSPADFDPLLRRGGRIAPTPPRTRNILQDAASPLLRWSPFAATDEVKLMEIIHIATMQSMLLITARTLDTGA